MSIAASGDRQDTLDQLPDSVYAESITSLEDNITALDEHVTDLDRNVVEIDRQTTEGEQTVISLASDVLFASNEASVPKRARDKVEELLAEIPEGAAVDVHGHTDSVDTEAYNQDLSERRARAVADILEKARPDLKLKVKGFGEMEPVAPNEKGGEDHPEGRALNRRVEIRYEG